MATGRIASAEEAEFEASIQRVLTSPSRKKLVVAGPGTGKTTLFRQLLELGAGTADRCLVLTFINNLKDDLEKGLAGLAVVCTLHSYCLGLLYRNTTLRANLSRNLRCCPGLAGLIKEDWECIEKSAAPQFVREMRNLDEENHISFYLKRGEFYDAVDFDDTVYRVYSSVLSGKIELDSYDLVLVDEYQDFNRLEAGFIDVLAQTSPIVVAGDDDQALYSQFRDSDCEYIRSLHNDGEYEVFELPFCMRCPKVVVDAVGDVIAQARRLRKLEGRIPKPYRHFPPVKGVDSAKYPKIALVETTVQRQAANYMGQYIEQAIAGIPADEIEAAAADGYPAALVIAAQPYRGQIIGHLESVGRTVDTRRDLAPRLDRELGLSILKEDQNSNLGWRIVLGADAPPFLGTVVARTANSAMRVIEAVPEVFREKVLAEVVAYQPPVQEPDEERVIGEPTMSIKVTSFEGAKGLSAQHVFMAGLHDNELPRNPASIQDLEICKFIVGLTRTRKRCTLIYTRHFANKWMSPSAFISWISESRLDRITVDAKYWRAR